MSQNWRICRVTLAHAHIHAVCKNVFFVKTYCNLYLTNLWFLIKLIHIISKWRLLCSHNLVICTHPLLALTNIDLQGISVTNRSYRDSLSAHSPASTKPCVMGCTAALGTLLPTLSMNSVGSFTFPSSLCLEVKKILCQWLHVTVPMTQSSQLRSRRYWAHSQHDRKRNYYLNTLLLVVQSCIWSTMFCSGVGTLNNWTNREVVDLVRDWSKRIFGMYRNSLVHMQEGWMNASQFCGKSAHLT